MASPAPAPALALSMAGILTLSPFGVSMETTAAGVVLASVGVFGRFAFDMQRASEAGQKLTLKQSLGWVGAGLVGAPFVTILWITILRSIGAQTDVLTIIGLLFLGFVGPKGVSMLVNLAGNTIARALPKGAGPAPEVKP